MSLGKLVTNQFFSQSRIAADRQSRRSHLRKSTKIETENEIRSPMRELTLINKPSQLRSE